MSTSSSRGILTRITIDNHCFLVTRPPALGECCILWIRDDDWMSDFEALGRFSEYDQRRVLEFVIRYVTNPRLREEIGKKRFECHMNGLVPADLQRIAELEDEEERLRAFRSLFNLDSVIDEAVDLNWKKRVMARKFHPDRGGDNDSMSLINEGYDHLSRQGY